MTVKVIVTDMDGTFLDDAKKYDHARFMAQYQELKKRGIEFVVASGNQYYQLISFFPELKDEISFVAENGALVYEHGKQLFHGELTRHESRIVIGELLKDKQLNFVACGLKSAYVSEHAPESFVALMSKHYHRLQPVKDYQDIDDVLFKFSLNLPDQQIPFVVDALHTSLDGIMKPVTSGFGFIKEGHDIVRKTSLIPHGVATHVDTDFFFQGARVVPQSIHVHLHCPAMFFIFGH